jgi:prepilin-type N-terminal cleavage/methylation domain-containing protein
VAALLKPERGTDGEAERRTGAPPRTRPAAARRGRIRSDSGELGRVHRADDKTAILGVEVSGGLADQGRVELRITADGAATPRRSWSATPSVTTCSASTWSHSPTRPGSTMSSRRDGFTLLEVLAAVAILGIAYITLGSSGIQGLQHEGEARRRLEASLLADSVLSEIEAGLEAGAAPPLGEEESEADGFTIAVEVEPFSIVVPEEQDKNGKRLGDARSRLGGSGAQAQDPVIPGPSLLGDDSGPGVVSPLRRIDVDHLERNRRALVSRTTFALDAMPLGHSKRSNSR